MKTKLLDYYKMILHKVSFEPSLLFKEYQKAVNTLQSNEVGDLDDWLRANGLYAAVAEVRKNRT